MTPNYANHIRVYLNITIHPIYYITSDILYNSKYPTTGAGGGGLQKKSYKFSNILLKYNTPAYATLN